MFTKNYPSNFEQWFVGWCLERKGDGVCTGADDFRTGRGDENQIEFATQFVARIGGWTLQKFSGSAIKKGGVFTKGFVVVLDGDSEQLCFFGAEIRWRGGIERFTRENLAVLGEAVGDQECIVDRAGKPERRLLASCGGQFGIKQASQSSRAGKS